MQFFKDPYPAWFCRQLLLLLLLCHTAAHARSDTVSVKRPVQGYMIMNRYDPLIGPPPQQFELYSTSDTLRSLTAGIVATVFKVGDDLTVLVKTDTLYCIYSGLKQTGCHKGDTVQQDQPIGILQLDTASGYCTVRTGVCVVNERNARKYHYFSQPELLDFIARL